MYLDFHDELRHRFPRSVFFLGVERNKGFTDSDALVQKALSIDREQLFGLSDYKEFRQRSERLRCYGVYTSDRTPFCDSFRRAVDNRRFQYLSDMVVTTPHAMDNTFGTHRSNAECRDIIRAKLEKQLASLNRVVERSESVLTAPRAGVSGVTDHRQRRAPGLHDDLAMAVMFAIGYWRMLGAGKLQTTAPPNYWSNILHSSDSLAD